MANNKEASQRLLNMLLEHQKRMETDPKYREEHQKFREKIGADGWPLYTGTKK